MKQRCKIFSAVVFALMWTDIIPAQEIIPATGGNAVGSGGTVSFTVGQVVWNIFQGSTGSFLQGVQQPFEISVVTAVQNTEYINLVCIAYPNPTSGQLKLRVESSVFNDIRFQLYSLKGLVLKDEKIISEETEIHMENLPSSVYFLRVFLNEMEVKVFRIIKR